MFFISMESLLGSENLAVGNFYLLGVRSLSGKSISLPSKCQIVFDFLIFSSLAAIT